MNEKIKPQQKVQVSTMQNFYGAEQPVQQPDVQQKFIHLQTILMMTQLNSAYFQMQLTLEKIFTKLQNKILQQKLHSFLTITLFQRNIYHSRHRFKEELLVIQQYQQNHNLIRNNEQELSKDGTESKLKCHNIFSKFQDKENIKCTLIFKCKTIIKKMFRILKQKRSNILSSSFYHLRKNEHQASTIQMYSQKSSKIQTNDSQKSKIFRRSNQKKISRKSFSVEKSATKEKHQYYIPIKYQPNNKFLANGSPGLTKSISANEESWINIDNNVSSAQINKYLQNRGQLLNVDRRNTLMDNKDRKVLKTNSSKKINVSLMIDERKDKIKQLQYLKRKYKKLISQFNWFSERFLKVIQQEEYVK